MWGLGDILYEMIFGVELIEKDENCSDYLSKFLNELGSIKEEDIKDKVAKLQPKYINQRYSNFNKILEKLLVPDPTYRMTFQKLKEELLTPSPQTYISKKTEKPRTKVVFII